MKCLWITEHVIPKRPPRDRGAARGLRAQRLSLVNIDFTLKYHYELQGVTGVRKVKGHVLDIVVMSMDNKVSEH